MNANELDKIFDNGGDITKYLDISSARRPNLEQKRVNVDIPIWMVESLDRESKRIGVTRQSIMKLWLAERLKKETKDSNKSFEVTL